MVLESKFHASPFHVVLHSSSSPELASAELATNFFFVVDDGMMAKKLQGAESLAADLTNCRFLFVDVLPVGSEWGEDWHES